MDFKINVEVVNKKDVVLNMSAIQGNFVFDFKSLALVKSQLESLRVYFKRYNGKILKSGENLMLNLMTDKGVRVLIRFIYELDFKGDKILKLYVESECIKCAMIVEREEIVEFYNNLTKVSKLFEDKKKQMFNNIQLRMLLVWIKIFISWSVFLDFVFDKI